MNDNDSSVLEGLQIRHKFRYHYTLINFVELVSHLEDGPSQKCANPFNMFKLIFKRIQKHCENRVLPSPEFEFLKATKLEHYMEPAWIIDSGDLGHQIELIVNASDVARIKNVIDIDHYKSLRKIDGKSIETFMQDLKKLKPPVSSANSKEIINWFRNVAYFFLFERPCSRKKRYNCLTQDEQRRFDEALLVGPGRLFYNHCLSRLKKIVNEGKSIDPNDLYDMLQLIGLPKSNRLFVTHDSSYFNYHVKDPDIQLVVPWRCFRKSA